VNLQPAIDLIKKFEGCSLTAYKCSAGVWTIGYGHTHGVKEGDVITQEEAEKHLLADIEDVSYDLYDFKGLTHNQECAIVSLIYNIGRGNFLRSTLCKRLDAGDMKAAAEEFTKWCYAGGKKLPGLSRRRNAEKKLFLTPDPNPQVD
jgi:lysozyme